MIPFKARPDGKIALTLDNNAWHFFFKEEIDLATELPSARFAITMPREVDIEWQAAPDGGDNDRRKRYIEAALSSGTVEVRWLFGFSEMNPASGPQRVAGFDQGVWLEEEEGAFVHRFQAHFATAAMRPTGLKKDEADAWVGSRSFSSIVLTCESPDKRGPLKVAKRLGGKILYLQNMSKSGLSLREYVEDYFKTF